MKISTEFSKNAITYEKNNIIQNMVIDKLLTFVKNKPKNILDLGCGNGALCYKINWEYDHFVGIDFAPGMLELHPKSEKIEAIYGDFNNQNLFKYLEIYRFDYIFSASALQWAEDLDMIFKNLKYLQVPFALAIFSANTFKTLNETASLKSLLRSVEEIDKLQKKYFDTSLEVLEYKLEFESTRDIFRYIKESGVSGSRKILNYKQTKELMINYPLNYLEFEVVFIHNNGGY